MEYKKIPPKYGSIVRAKSKNGYRYGVYISDEEVITFGPLELDPFDKDGSVRKLSLDDFALDAQLEVLILNENESKNLANPQNIVQKATKFIGGDSYHTIYNNSEHFVKCCLFGIDFCSDSKNSKDHAKDSPILNVYYAIKPNREPKTDLLPIERQKEVDECSNKKVKTDMYFVWKLLEYGLKDSFGLDISKIDIKKNEFGKWESPECFFSLSHSEDIVMVAISNNLVGVDLQIYNPEKVHHLETKILTSDELKVFNSLFDEDKPLYLTQKWTQKESYFKTLNIKPFIPHQIEVKNTKSFVLTMQGKTYLYSITLKDQPTPNLIKVNL